MTFYCGTSKEDAEISCEFPCPDGLFKKCPDQMSCFAFTTCAINTTDETESTLMTTSEEEPVPGYCGTSFQNATETCSSACSVDAECLDGQSCYGYDRDSFYAAMSCHQHCPSGSSAECPDNEFCFLRRLAMKLNLSSVEWN
jgi:hypothetical protein